MRLIDADRLILSLESEYANFESEKDYKTALCTIGNAKTVDAYLFADVKRIEEQAIKDTKVKCRRLKGHWHKGMHTADFQITSQMRLSELRTLLDNYDDKDMVQLRIYGSSDCPSADLVINDNTIMSDEY